MGFPITPYQQRCFLLKFANAISWPKNKPTSTGKLVEIFFPNLGIPGKHTKKPGPTESLKPQFDHLQNAMDQWCNKQIPHHWSAVTGAVKWHDSEGASESEPSWWLNQPIWKICSSKWIISQGRDENKKCLKPAPSHKRDHIEKENYGSNH